LTVDCREFRRAAGADPGHLTVEANSHRAACPGCAEFLRQARVLDDRILAALRVPVPERHSAAVTPNVVAFPRIERRRWMALAASIAGGVMIGSLLWLSAPRASLAEDVIKHMAHEPGVMVASSAPEDASRVERVMERGGIRLRSDAGMVSYAQTCRLRGQKVPHLVVQTDAGPVTVMVLRNEKVTAPVQFAEQGYVGTILPAGPGSVVVLGPTGADLSQVGERVAAAVVW
jgi:hypothetical protein